MIRTVTKFVISAVIFVVAMIVMTIVCTVAWETCLAGKVYVNTDDGDGGGYPSAGNWVGNDEGFPIVLVKQMMPVNSMGDPDELKIGWSVGRLRVVSRIFFGISLLVSIWLAALPSVNLVSLARRAKTPYKIAVVAVIMALLIPGFLLANFIPPVSLTQGRMIITERRIIQYARQYDHLPSDLSDLPPMPGYDTATTDGWGRPLDYSVDAFGSVTLRSFGAGRQPGGVGGDQGIQRVFAARDDNGQWQANPFASDAPYEKWEGEAGDRQMLRQWRAEHGLGVAGFRVCPGLGASPTNP
jgi:hypothetical protein